MILISKEELHKLWVNCPDDGNKCYIHGFWCGAFNEGLDVEAAGDLRLIREMYEMGLEDGIFDREGI